ncbi:hypothetical protein CFI14_05660 [Lactiplantibacillus pentosus]|jgi:hypothetical protein|uniref:hypothetical protein n=1 Tax=Lactiplantibacillus pentosus TaxID=1589 RepID=UPI000D021F32|nr:hypothetical protein [Lactiplantibacillus pentosus]AYG37949.1 hypothetical protein CFK27_08505 [Lactiplantibacillus pentosus]AYG40607.1 hypothetical protein CFI14_05660 [Lactiplantibacillus pentosus]MBO9164676.1 hypothetical protein [Lactiplantibacillus pentosus]MCJ8182020.1 hypothetical protein [Lactiplantibacillus pentosus]MCT3311010.1 hypothetical protein [Lactiplantibacillus pentosus]
MQQLLVIDTSLKPDAALNRLTQTFASRCPYQQIQLATHLVFLAPTDDDEDEFMGICEAVRDTDILAIGIPEQVDQSAMRILVTRMLALKTDNPFSYKQLVLLTPTKDVDEKLFDVWSQVACHLNMDLVEVIDDVRSAKRAGHHLFQTVATTPVRFVFHYHRHK